MADKQRWTNEEIREAILERAAIREFDGGQPRKEAELAAREEIKDLMVRTWAEKD